MTGTIARAARARMSFRALERRLRPYWRTIFRSGEPYRRRKSLDFYSDGLGVNNRNLLPLSEPGFMEAWNFAVAGNREGWNDAPPDIRWRALTCCWAAKHALALDGDFVECGVHTGILSMTVCRHVDFAKLNRKFFLYDTFEGIPADALAGEERGRAKSHNSSLYFDCYEITTRNFAAFPNVYLVRGCLPESIGPEPFRIAYLSIDLNSETYERRTIEVLWPRLVRGAVVVIDDYGFQGYEAQHAMWNEFAARHGTSVLLSPTGQGILVKP